MSAAAAVALHPARLIRRCAATFVLDFEGAVSSADVAFVAERAFRFGGAEKVLRCGETALWAVRARALIEVDGRVICPMGVLRLMQDPTLAPDEALVDDPSADPEQNEAAFLVLRGVSVPGLPF